MKKLILLTLLALPLAAQDGFDFRTLDKLGTNSKNHTSVTLDSDMLKMAAGFLGSGKDSVDLKALVGGLKGIYIRSFEFANKGMYSPADLEPLRNYLKQGKWNKIVESKEDDEISEIYLLPQAGGTLGGVAIIAVEAREVTVVYINGTLRQEDIAKLSGTMGIPDIRGDLGNLKKIDKLQTPKKEED